MNLPKGCLHLLASGIWWLLIGVPSVRAQLNADCCRKTSPEFYVGSTKLTGGKPIKCESDDLIRLEWKHSCHGDQTFEIVSYLEGAQWTQGRPYEHTIAQLHAVSGLRTFRLAEVIPSGAAPGSRLHINALCLNNDGHGDVQCSVAPAYAIEVVEHAGLKPEISIITGVAWVFYKDNFGAQIGDFTSSTGVGLRLANYHRTPPLGLDWWKLTGVSVNFEGFKSLPNRMGVSLDTAFETKKIPDFKLSLGYAWHARTRDADIPSSGHRTFYVRVTPDITLFTPK